MIIIACYIFFKFLRVLPDYQVQLLVQIKLSFSLSLSLSLFFFNNFILSQFFLFFLFFQISLFTPSPPPPSLCLKGLEKACRVEHVILSTRLIVRSVYNYCSYYIIITVAIILITIIITNYHIFNTDHCHSCLKHFLLLFVI